MRNDTWTNTLWDWRQKKARKLKGCGRFGCIQRSCFMPQQVATRKSIEPLSDPEKHCHRKCILVRSLRLPGHLPPHMFPAARKRRGGKNRGKIHSAWEVGNKRDSKRTLNVKKKTKTSQSIGPDKWKPRETRRGKIMFIWPYCSVANTKPLEISPFCRNRSLMVGPFPLPVDRY